MSILLQQKRTERKKREKGRAALTCLIDFIFPFPSSWRWMSLNLRIRSLSLRFRKICLTYSLPIPPQNPFSRCCPQTKPGIIIGPVTCSRSSCSSSLAYYFDSRSLDLGIATCTELSRDGHDLKRSRSHWRPHSGDDFSPPCNFI